MELDDIRQLIVGNDNLNLKQIFFDASHPVDSTYVQYPQQKSPEDVFNKDGVTSTWQVINYSGAFFRAEGGNAATFIKETDTLIKQGELIKGHTHSVDTNDTWTGHTQPGFSGSNTTLTSYGSTYDTSKTLTGVIASGIPNRADVTSGCFSKTKDGYHEYDGGDWGGSEVSWDGTHSHNVKVSVNYTPSGSIDYHNHYIPSLSGTAYANDNIETRPSNFTIKIWKRIS